MFALLPRGLVEPSPLVAKVAQLLAQFNNWSAGNEAKLTRAIQMKYTTSHVR